MYIFISRYFSEFKVLKGVSRDFWLTNAIQFVDCLAYFSMITPLTLYLTTNCGFNDVDSGAWVGIFTLFITAFVFAVGSICDVINIRKSLFIGAGVLLVSRLLLALAPTQDWLKGTSLSTLTHSILTFLPADTFTDTDLKLTVKLLLLLMAFGTAFMSPVLMTSLRRFTSRANRATGFNVNYLIVNIGAIIAGAGVIDGLRRGMGEFYGNLAIFGFGMLMAALSLVFSYFIKEDNYGEEDERITASESSRRPLVVFMEVWKESAFRKLLLFLVLTIGVRLVFTHQFLVMPKYYTRVLTSDFELGLANAINPLIIVIGLILIIPVINRFATVKLVIIGMAISASSLLFMAVPLEWILRLPFINTVTQAYFFIIVAQILVFAFGELIFSPRFTEYTASVAPKDKVSSYMALSALPAFISKPINGFASGILISMYCYDGIKPKIETGNVGYWQSPEFMWLIYLILAVMSPVVVIALRDFITSKSEPVAKEGGAP
jgi:proton-dependent oligopeptide transporter, POT family